MRCKACDKILEEKELTKKDNHGNFLDLCNGCLFASVDYSVDDIGTITEDLDLTFVDVSDTLY
jgi:hypothetical protein